MVRRIIRKVKRKFRTYFLKGKIDNVIYLPTPVQGGWRRNASKFDLKTNPWSERMEIMISLIDFSEIRSIMDLGAGGQNLKDYLTDAIEYIPVDNIQREYCGETIICDFNKGEFPDCKADCAFCAGILEYIERPAEWIKNVCEHCKQAVIAYHVAELGCDIAHREDNGWVNHITCKKLIELFKDNGFNNVVCKDEGSWGMLFKFVRED